ncbi:hypothetical protein AB0N56_35185 [Streptomyces microflavus]|uniref:hypothetical protein n=1 Tax=Streptomyces microflavus TaxID=1919 RepID=UPI002255C4CB|nr:hypothetical protein [Streptomyces microflavus]MCX4657575.1 hypothetical protein [Streptomyces microflavus]
MNVPIDVGAGLIFLASVAVGYIVHRHTQAASTTTPPTGDIGVSFTAGSATLIALAFLFGVPAPGSDSAPAPTTSQTQNTTPAAPNHTAVPGGAAPDVPAPQATGALPSPR